MGGSKAPSMPSPPPPPSPKESVQAWVDAMPQVYETQMKYAPKQAAQAVDLAQQYAGPLGQAMQAAQRELYPETSAIQEELAASAREGYKEGVPDWMRKQYLSDMRANLGTNIGSPIGASALSRGLLQQQEDWRRYHRNLGLSLAGRSPLAQPATPSTGQYSQNFKPQDVMSMQAQTYGPYASAYGSMYNANAQMAMQPSAFGTMMGGLMGGLGSGLSYGIGGMFGGR